MIIIGYQGIGKSTIAGNCNCIDLESGNFFVNGKRDENWYIPYCNIAVNLSKQGYTVFVSSHKEVREELKKTDEVVYCIVPGINLKDEWIKKLKNRFNETGLDKDYKAWKNAEERYIENIGEIILSGYNVYVINSNDYDLQIIVKIIRHSKP